MAGRRERETDVGASAFRHERRAWSFDRPHADQHVAAYILLLFRVHEDLETGIWEGVCEELGVASCGDTYHGALEATLDATEDYLNVLEELGERDQVFRERDLRLDDVEPVVPVSRDLPPGEHVSAQRGVLIDG